MEKAAEIQMLKDFSNANATSGFENEFVDLFTKTVKDYADLEVDGMLNVYASKKQNTGKRPVIQLDAHSDAVGFLTQAIRPNGLIKFVTLGGWNNVVLPALQGQGQKPGRGIHPRRRGFKAAPLHVGS